MARFNMLKKVKSLSIIEINKKKKELPITSQQKKKTKTANEAIKSNEKDNLLTLKYRQNNIRIEIN